MIGPAKWPAQANQVAFIDGNLHLDSQAYELARAVGALWAESRAKVGLE